MRLKEANILVGDGTMTRIGLRFLVGGPDSDRLDSGLCLAIYVDDIATPRSQVRLVELVRQRGSRPLNIRRTGQQRVIIRLLDPNGAWSKAGRPLEMGVAYR